MPSQHNPPPAAGRGLTILSGVVFIVVAIGMSGGMVWLHAIERVDPSPWFLPVWIFVFTLFSTGCVLLFGYRPLDPVEATVRIARAVHGQPDPRDRPPTA